MADGQAGSTVPRRQLGRSLRELREKAGLTVKAVAKELERSAPTIWRIEAGQTSMRVVEVKAMCELYGASSEMTAALVGLAGETKAKGWWQAFGDVVPEGFDLYVGLEAAANRIDWYESELVPGLFQTAGYTREIIRVHLSHATEAEVERLVEVRTGRQAILRRPIDPLALRVVLRESVLRCPVGGSAVMAEQLSHLASLAHLPNVMLRVVPFAAGAIAGMISGPFEILRFPVKVGGLESEPPTVYADSYTGALYLDKPNEVDRYDQAFGQIWDAALDERASRELILKSAEELR